MEIGQRVRIFGISSSPETTVVFIRPDGRKFEEIPTTTGKFFELDFYPNLEGIWTVRVIGETVDETTFEVVKKIPMDMIATFPSVGQSLRYEGFAIVRWSEDVVIIKHDLMYEVLEVIQDTFVTRLSTNISMSTSTTSITFLVTYIDGKEEELENSEIEMEFIRRASIEDGEIIEWLEGSDDIYRISIKELNITILQVARKGGIPFYFRNPRDIEFQSISTIKVPAGEFECWYIEESGEGWEIKDYLVKDIGVCTLTSMVMETDDIIYEDIRLLCSWDLEFEEEIRRFFPNLIFDEKEEFYPTNFLFDDRYVENNPEKYNETWPMFCYVHTCECTINTTDYLVIQYWFYYCKDGGVISIKLNEEELELVGHDHDWESIFVFCTRSEEKYTPRMATYFHHINLNLITGEKKDCYSVYQWGKWMDTNGFSPVVHVSRWKHASYAKTFLGYGLCSISIEPIGEFPIWEACDDGKELDYEDFMIMYVDSPYSHWPEKFGTIDAPWKRERWNYPERIIQELPKFIKFGSLIGLQETKGKLCLHVYDNQSRHVGFNPATNQSEIEIKGAFYSEIERTTFIVLPKNLTSFKIIVDATFAEEEVEQYDLLIVTMKEEIIEEKKIVDEIEKNEKQEIRIGIEPTGELKPVERVFSVEWEGKVYLVNILSNSTVTNFQFDQPSKQISFNASQEVGVSFCNVTIPKELLRDNITHPWEISITNGELINCKVYYNETHSFIYTLFRGKQVEIKLRGAEVIPELSIPLLSIILTIFTLIVVLSKNSNPPFFSLCIYNNVI